MPDCPLCRSDRCSRFASLDRVYWDCPSCRLVFVDPADLPDPERELAEYRLHDNRIDDPGYRSFLAQLVDPLLRRISPAGSTALDYGSGPVPALRQMLVKAGMKAWVYDPYFAPDATVLDRQYDVVTCTETVEHFHNPAMEFQLLRRILAPKGCLAIMTMLLDDTVDFASWHYRRDITHVSFYRRETMHWIANTFGWTYVPHSHRVHFFDSTAETELS